MQQVRPRQLRAELRASRGGLQGRDPEEADLVHVETLLRLLGILPPHHALHHLLLEGDVGLRRHLPREKSFQCLYSFITKVDFNVCIRFLLLKLISMFVFVSYF